MSNALRTAKWSVRAVRLEVTLGDGLSVGVADASPSAVADSEVGAGVPVGLGIALSGWMVSSDDVGSGVDVSVPVGVAVGVADGLSDAGGVAGPDDVGAADTTSESDDVVASVELSEPDGVLLAESDGVAVAEPVGVPVGVPEPVDVAVVDGVAEADDAGPLAVGVVVGVSVEVTVGGAVVAGLSTTSTSEVASDLSWE
ncbi:MAG TPA: hypothetical protein VIS06_06755 [Mycobacteriales bacterium]